MRRDADSMAGWDGRAPLRPECSGAPASAWQPLEPPRKEAEMSVLSRLASALGRRDEEPNKELGRQLVAGRDVEGIREVADNLWHEDKRIRADCLSVMEQVGLLEPELTEDYVVDFLDLISSRDNRLVWAAMINLALIAERQPQAIFERYDDLVNVIEVGSVITKDNGIRAMAKVASTSAEYEEAILPYLMEELRTCRSKSVPQYAESIRCAIGPDNQEEYLSILHERLGGLSDAQRKRVTRLLKAL